MMRRADLEQTMMHETKGLRRRSIRAFALLLGLLAGLSLWPSRAPAQERLSFGDALQRVQQRNESLMAGQDEIRQREAEKAAISGLKVPKAELDVRSTFLDADITTPFDPLPIAYKMQDKHFTKAELSVTWPVYTGGRIKAANRAATARQNEAEAQFRFTGDQLVTELAQRYFGVCLARRARTVTAFKVAATERHAHRAKRLLEEGIISRAESLSAEVALANARSELEAADRDVTIASEGLANTMAWTDPVEPVTALFLLRDLETRDYFQNSVDDQHPVLAVLGAKREQAHQGVRAEEGAALPTAYVFGMYELLPNGCSVVDPKWAFGFGGQYTLFDGDQGRNKVSAAKAQEERVAHLRQKYQRDLRSLTVKRYEEMEKAREQYDALDTTLALTAENLRVRTRAFEEGVATSLEVVDATLSHARAQLGRLKAAYDFDSAFFQLLESSGQTGRCQEYLARAVPVPENDAFPGPTDPSLVEPLDKKPAEPPTK
jgi:outer membrane protein TolC